MRLQQALGQRTTQKRQNELKLIVTDGGDGINSDHADWVNARLIK
ncbi:NPCBM/NEW2 domain-containing protein [Paenibacillus thiaminolyticus]